MIEARCGNCGSWCGTSIAGDLASECRGELVLAGGPAREKLAVDSEARRLEEIAVRAGVADLAVCAPWYERASLNLAVERR
jgi:hypothetical protein